MTLAIAGKLLHASTLAFDLSFARVVARSEAGEDAQSVEEARSSSALENRPLLESKLRSKDNDVVMAALALVDQFNFRQSQDKVFEVSTRIELGFAPKSEALQLLAKWHATAEVPKIKRLLRGPITPLTVDACKCLQIIDSKEGAAAAAQVLGDRNDGGPLRSRLWTLVGKQVMSRL